MILIKNGHVKTMAGPDLIGGDVLIENGKIKAVGMNLEAEGAQVIDANGRLVVPGFVDAHCHIGLDNEGMGWEGMDYNEIVEPCTPHLRAIDSINPIDESFPNAVKGGVTTAVTGPGSANVIGGTFVAIKLHGKRVDNMILKDNIAMKVAFGENPKRCYSNMKKSPSTRMATAALLREMLFKTKRYMEDKEAGKNPAFDMKLEAMIPVLKKEMPIKAHAHRADDIFTSIRIAREFDIDITLDHCTDGALIADELAKEGLPAFVGPTLGKKSKIELRNKSFETPGILNKAGVNISIITDAPVIPLQNLPLCAGLAVNAGLDMEEAWKAITINPANATGIGDRVGSLEVGKDADVVIHSGNPLTEISSQVDVAIINGEIVYER
ncbi:MAG: amidohydrolase [Clostridia bacterium]|nr:amidohydrolase [Clostridia bacterium]